MRPDEFVTALMDFANRLGREGEPLPISITINDRQYAALWDNIAYRCRYSASSMPYPYGHPLTLQAASGTITINKENYFESVPTSPVPYPVR